MVSGTRTENVVGHNHRSAGTRRVALAWGSPKYNGPVGTAWFEARAVEG